MKSDSRGAIILPDRQIGQSCRRYGYMSEPIAKALALRFSCYIAGGPLVIPTELLTELKRYVG